MNVFPPALLADRRPTILIVDDVPDSLELLDEMLRSEGYQTLVADSGARAIELARRVQPDLILLDVMMPGLDGFETCRRLKAHPETTSIPVVFVSACSRTDDVVSGFDHGAVDYIAKPVRLPEVRARVRTQLQMLSRSESQQRQARRLRLIVEGMDEGLMLVGPDGRIQYANPASQRCLGYKESELAGRTLASLMAEPAANDYAACFDQGDAAVSESCRGTREVLLRQADGKLRPMDLNLSSMAAGERFYIAMIHDISHHKRSETVLQRAALADSLTGIANRRQFDACLDKEWQRAVRTARPLSLLVLDVDHFKLFNDLLGHAAGDRCLQAVANTLQAHSLRATDLAARYGGEEFVLLLPDTPHAGAITVAESIRAGIEALRIPHPRSSSSDFVTVSVGAASFVPTQFDDIGSLFMAADRAMYEAKAAGRNRVRAVEGGHAREAMQCLRAP